MTDSLNQYQKVIATFTPIHRETLRPEASEKIGFRGEFQAAWVIEDGVYAGQWAMIAPPDFGGVAWVPLCDLSDLEGKP